MLDYVDQEIAAANGDVEFDRIIGYSGTTAQYLRGDGQWVAFPTSNSGFTNNAGYLTGVTSSQVTTALGYTPVNPHITIDVLTGTTYTIAAADNNKLLRFNSTSGVTATIPSGTTIAIGFSLSFSQTGTGQVTFSPASGVTLNSADAAYKTRVQYSVGTLIKVAADTWLLAGDLSA
ncbi:hypothetical protein GCM10023184_14860 [Flaviaesturariibacter amylovorans]|uniref:Uncharacterized protein n=2 Tax=Flaviaesturariibacter amylovorans TaxID=1084520 RepID=A0ABP8GKX8_9BACT